MALYSQLILKCFPHLLAPVSFLSPFLESDPIKFLSSLLDQKDLPRSPVTSTLLDLLANSKSLFNLLNSIWHSLTHLHFEILSPSHLLRRNTSYSSASKHPSSPELNLCISSPSLHSHPPNDVIQNPGLISFLHTPHPATSVAQAPPIFWTTVIPSELDSLSCNYRYQCNLFETLSLPWHVSSYQSFCVHSFPLGILTGHGHTGTGSRRPGTSLFFGSHLLCLVTALQSKCLRAFVLATHSTLEYFFSEILCLLPSLSLGICLKATLSQRPFLFK